MADVAIPKAAPKFKQRAMRTFKSKAPKPGQKGFGDDIPGMEGLGPDITVCGKPSGTWSSATWPNMKSSSPEFSQFS
ncbi:hypothetical protein PBY51_020242 [Eleginops maclovinus]|uniref:3',5'-cyclic-GMP phosphodiesterase n=1 Tax=Eleginops maclovinus TaxID=56733 RepID=A0AAN8AKH9_ELEMC|nr:hypothetical protein PBY51_020242 [Eleginops maclovinus]